MTPNSSAPSRALTISFSTDLSDRRPAAEQQNSPWTPGETSFPPTLAVRQPRPRAVLCRRTRALPFRPPARRRRGYSTPIGSAAPPRWASPRPEERHTKVTRPDTPLARTGEHSRCPRPAISPVLDRTPHAPFRSAPSVLLSRMALVEWRQQLSLVLYRTARRPPSHRGLRTCPNDATRLTA